MDGRWKRAILAALPERAERVLDLACGTGIVLEQLAKRYPDAELVGVDLTEEYLDVARAKLAKIGVAATLVHANAETAPLEGKFDTVCSSYLPKYVDADRLIDHLTPHVAPGGTVAFHDFTYPKGLVPRWGWRVWMHLLSTGGRRVFPAWEKAFDKELMHKIVRSRWPKEFAAALTRRGYEDVTIQALSSRMATLVSARMGRA